MEIKLCDVASKGGEIRGRVTRCVQRPNHSLSIVLHRILAQQFSYAIMADRGFFFATIKPLQYEAFTRQTSFLWVDVQECLELPVTVYLL